MAVGIEIGQAKIRKGAACWNSQTKRPAVPVAIKMVTLTATGKPTVNANIALSGQCGNFGSPKVAGRSESILKLFNMELGHYQGMSRQQLGSLFREHVLLAQMRARESVPDLGLTAWFVRCHPTC